MSGRITGLRRAAKVASIVHLHLWAPWYPFALAKACRNGRVVSHLHCAPTSWTYHANLRNRVERISDSWILGRSVCVIASSEWIAKEWSAVGLLRSQPVDVVPNGIVIPDRIELREMGTVIGVASRLTELKGLEELVAALPQIARRLPSVSLRIAGEGPLRPALVSLVAKSPIPVDFVGHITEMEPFWSSVDISLFTSPSEAFGLGLIEPVAYGIPVIAYLNGSGSDEVIAACRGIRGVPYGETESLAEAVADILTDRNNRIEMSKLGREDCIARFSIDAMDQAVAKIYGRMKL